MRISAWAFRLVPASPLLGRPLVDADEDGSAPSVAVLGEALWQSRFNRDPLIVGRAVTIAGVRHTIVGVMPKAFGFPVNQNSVGSVPRRRLAGEERGRAGDLSVRPACARRDARRSPGRARRGDGSCRRRRPGVESAPARGSEAVCAIAHLGPRLQEPDPRAVRGEPGLHRAPGSVRRERRDARVRTHCHTRSGDYCAHGARCEPRPRRLAAGGRSAGARIDRRRRRPCCRARRSPLGAPSLGNRAGQCDAILVGRAAQRRNASVYGTPRPDRGADHRRDPRTQGYRAEDAGSAQGRRRWFDDEVRQAVDRHHRHAGRGHRRVPAERGVAGVEHWDHRTAIQGRRVPTQRLSDCVVRAEQR